MTELRGFWKYVVETVKLTVALLLYSWLSPMWQPFVPDHPYIGGGLAGITAAAAVLMLTYLIWPFARVRVVVQRSATDAPYEGPSADLVAGSNSKRAGTYRLRIHSQSFGLLGWLALRAAAKRELRVSFRIATPALALSTEGESSHVDELDDGILVTLPARPSTSTWSYVRLTAASKDMPAHAEVDVITELQHSKKKPWWAFGLRSSSNLKRIVLILKEN